VFVINRHYLSSIVNCTFRISKADFRLVPFIILEAIHAAEVVFLDCWYFGVVVAGRDLVSRGTGPEGGAASASPTRFAGEPGEKQAAGRRGVWPVADGL
jgi:hypothetical protein